MHARVWNLRFVKTLVGSFQPLGWLLPAPGSLYPLSSVPTHRLHLLPHPLLLPGKNRVQVSFYLYFPFYTSFGQCRFLRGKKKVDLIFLCPPRQQWKGRRYQNLGGVWISVSVRGSRREGRGQGIRKRRKLGIELEFNKFLLPPVFSFIIPFYHWSWRYKILHCF